MQPDSTEKEDITRIPRIWGYASGGIIGLSGILAIFWWMGAELLFGLLFWGMFAVGFFTSNYLRRVDRVCFWCGDLGDISLSRHCYYVWILLKTKFTTLRKSKKSV